jgi:hypothetical protein
MAERFHLVVARCTAAIADIEDDLMLQLTASGFEVTEVEDEVAAAAQAEAEEKAARAASRKAEVRVNRWLQATRRPSDWLPSLVCVIYLRRYVCRAQRCAPCCALLRCHAGGEGRWHLALLVADLHDTLRSLCSDRTLHGCLAAQG